MKIPDLQYSRDRNRCLTACSTCCNPPFIMASSVSWTSRVDYGLSGESLWWFSFSLLYSLFVAVFFLLLTRQSRVTVFAVVMLSSALYVELALSQCDWIQIKSCSSAHSGEDKSNQSAPLCAATSLMVLDHFNWFKSFSSVFASLCLSNLPHSVLPLSLWHFFL